MLDLETYALLKATWETIYIVFISGSLSILFGGVLGFILFFTREKQIFSNKCLHQILNVFVNTTRSIPFIILMISILPFTRFLVGTTIGINAAIVPLTLTAIPFFARLCENALLEIPAELFEAADVLGVSTSQLITKILIPESWSALIKAITLTIIGLIGYSAMAGAIGGGGLGELAINYGYQRFNIVVTLETVVLLVLIVQLVQFGGEWLSKTRKIKPLLLGSVLLGLVCFGSQVYPLLISQQTSITVGVISGWSEDVMKTAQEVALKEYGLTIKIKTFTEYVLPNSALASGDIDANIFQHIPYLETQNKANHYQLISLAKTFVYPMGFYSKKIHKLSDLRTHAIVAIPNDASNEARALLLLQKEHLILLKSGVSTLATVRDIVNNPKHLQFKLLDAAQLPRVLVDADLVAITNDFVNAAGLRLSQALLHEGADSLYANIIAVRKQDQDKPELQILTKVMHSTKVKEATEKMFPDDSAIPAW